MTTNQRVKMIYNKRHMLLLVIVSALRRTNPICYNRETLLPIRESGPSEILLITPQLEV